MLGGIIKAAGSDYGISTTGIAGPTGDTPTKPIGLVYIAVGSRIVLSAENLSSLEKDGCQESSCLSCSGHVKRFPQCRKKLTFYRTNNKA